MGWRGLCLVAGISQGDCRSQKSDRSETLLSADGPISGWVERRQGVDDLDGFEADGDDLADEIELRPGLRIGQICFFSMSRRSLITYDFKHRAKYWGANRATNQPNAYRPRSSGKAGNGNNTPK